MPATPLLRSVSSVTSTDPITLRIHNRSGTAVRICLVEDVGGSSDQPVVPRPGVTVQPDTLGELRCDLVDVTTSAGACTVQLEVRAGTQRWTARVATRSLAKRKERLRAARCQTKGPGIDRARWSLLPLTPGSAASARDRIEEKPVLGEAPTSVWALQSHPVRIASPLDLLLLPTASPSRHLSALPGSALLSSLTLAGTHESASQYGWPLSSCQPPTTLLEQLRRGIRFLDIRLSIKGEGASARLLAYHGLTDQRIPFDAILAQCFAFLDTNRNETILMSLKQENALPGFKELLLERHVYPFRFRWFLEPRIPTLAECRGRIVMISRFGSSTEQPGGIHPPLWPDSCPTPFRYALPSHQDVETQDWYNIGSLASLSLKFRRILDLLRSSGAVDGVLTLNYTSASSFPLALPPFVARGFREEATVLRWFSVRGINSRLFDELARRLCLDTPGSDRAGDCESRRVGASDLMCTFALDYYDHPRGLVELLMAANAASARDRDRR